MLCTAACCVCCCCVVGGDDPEAVALEGQIAELSTEQLQSRIRMFDNNIRVMKSESGRLQHEITTKQAAIKDNNEKIKMVRTAALQPAHLRTAVF